MVIVAREGKKREILGGPGEGPGEGSPAENKRNKEKKKVKKRRCHWPKSNWPKSSVLSADGVGEEGSWHPNIGQKGQK